MFIHQDLLTDGATGMGSLLMLALRWRIQLLSVRSCVFFLMSSRSCRRSFSACDSCPFFLPLPAANEETKQRRGELYLVFNYSGIQIKITQIYSNQTFSILFVNALKCRGRFWLCPMQNRTNWIKRELTKNKKHSVAVKGEACHFCITNKESPNSSGNGDRTECDESVKVTWNITKWNWNLNKNYVFLHIKWDKVF